MFRMDGFKAYKYYLAIKLHFTNPKFNVFVNRGKLKGSVDKFLLRNDHLLFEKMAKQFHTDKELIQFVAANFMYNNPSPVYNLDESMSNYKEYLRRKQSITRVFEDDLDTIVKSGARYYDFSGQKIPDVVQLYLGKRITLETLVILDTFDGLVEKLQQNNHLCLLLGDELMRITKARGFVRFDPKKVINPYIHFIEETKRPSNG